jgi:hypothetical protein
MVSVVELVEDDEDDEDEDEDEGEGEDVVQAAAPRASAHTATTLSACLFNFTVVHSFSLVLFSVCLRRGRVPTPIRSVRWVAAAAPGVVVSVAGWSALV